MSFAERDGVIWLDGKLVPWREATTHVLTHSLHYGAGVFEGVRAYGTDSGPALFRLQEHTARLFRSAHILGMKIPFDQEVINEAQVAVIRANNLSEAYLRPLCFYGSEGMGLSADNLAVHCVVAAWEWPHLLAPEVKERGIVLRTSSFTRHHVNITLCRAKATGNYLNSMMAYREARDSGADEALLLDSEGYVAEGSGQNIFILKDDGILYTPQPGSCLAGITRDTVMRLAHELGIEVRESRISRDEVYTAQEAFLVGTAAEIVPVIAHDGRQIGTGKPGPVGRRIVQLYADLVRGRLSQWPDWLTWVHGSGRRTIAS